MRNLATNLWVQFLLRRRLWLLAVAVLLALISLAGSRQLQFDRSIENMFTSDDQVLGPYRQLKRTFGGNEIVLAVYRDPKLFDRTGKGIDRVRLVQRQLAAVPGVKAVLSIDQPLPGNTVVSRTVIAERTRRLFQGYTHGSDEETVAVVCMLYPENETNVARRHTIDKLRAVMHSLPNGLEPGYLTGEPVLVVDGFRYVEQDGKRLGLWSAILLGGTIIFCFRSIRWVLIPVAVVQLAIIMTNGVLFASGLKLSMVSSMLTAVVMVIAVATMVHVIVRFLEARGQGLSTYDALARTLTILSVPIMWACATDAVGFLALTTSEVGPVRDFGIMMAIGALMVLLSVFLVVPACAILGKIDSDPHKPWGQDELNRGLQGSVSIIERYPRRILLLILFVSAIGISGMRLTEIETDFTKNFRQDSDIVQSYKIVENNLGGAGVCDIIVPAPEHLDWNYLKKVRDFTNEIDDALSQMQAKRDEEGSTTKTLSLGAAISVMAQPDKNQRFCEIVSLCPHWQQ